MGQYGRPCQQQLGFLSATGAVRRAPKEPILRLRKPALIQYNKLSPYRQCYNVKISNTKRRETENGTVDKSKKTSPQSNLRRARRSLVDKTSTRIANYWDCTALAC